MENGFLTIELRVQDVYPIVDFLRKRSRSTLSDDMLTSRGLEEVHRSTRMAWEATIQSRMSCLDAGDCRILYDAEMSEDLEWVHRILNQVRSSLTETATTPVMGDGYAKSVCSVMSS